jgi:hypothetical protein
MWLTLDFTPEEEMLKIESVLEFGQRKLEFHAFSNREGNWSGVSEILDGVVEG